jgi:hypothetical protein
MTIESIIRARLAAKAAPAVAVVDFEDAASPIVTAAHEMQFDDASLPASVSAADDVSLPDDVSQIAKAVKRRKGKGKS